MEESNTLQCSIGFYIHHHGSGHLMRAIRIAKMLGDISITFLGSNLMPYVDLIPDGIICTHLPLDLPEANEVDLPQQQLTFLHYAPLGVNGIRERVNLLTDFFKRNYPMLLIVDVSVEVTLLARLCSIPTIVIRQHGRRTDPAHLQAYESAELLIAPFSPAMASFEEVEWVQDKTLYAGGFSKYADHQYDEEEKSEHIAILLGDGGTSMNVEFIQRLADGCKTYTFHVVGRVENSQAKVQHNVIWHGHLKKPAEILGFCAVVIGNAGHNTVMEMADLNKRFICIPEDRPFGEQVEKAALLARNGNATVIQPEDLTCLHWPSMLELALKKQPYWVGVTSKDALGKIAVAIKDTFDRIFMSK